MTAAVLAPLVLGDPARHPHYAATLALLVGGICLGAGLFKLGFLSNLLSRPVLVGLLTGIAFVMVVGQLGRLTGVAASGDTVVAQAALYWPESVKHTGPQ